MGQDVAQATCPPTHDANGSEGATGLLLLFGTRVIGQNSVEYHSRLH